MFSPLFHHLQDLCTQRATPISRRCVRITPATLMKALPALGCVLYVPMRPPATSRWELPRGWLVETMQLSPLLQIHFLTASSTISVDGPREWFDCFDRAGLLCARLYLLPDTDYLAWDALADGESVSQPSPRLRRTRPAGAKLMRFHHHRLAGLDVLGGETTDHVSPLSKQRAVHITRVEALAWQAQVND